MKLWIALMLGLSAAVAHAETKTENPQDYLCAISLGELHALVNTHPSLKGKFAENFAGQFAGTWVDENGIEQFKISAKAKLEIHGVDLKVCPQANGKLYGITKYGMGYLTLTDSGEGIRIHDTSPQLKMIRGKYYRSGSSTALKVKRKKQEANGSWSPF